MSCSSTSLWTYRAQSVFLARTPVVDSLPGRPFISSGLRINKSWKCVISVVLYWSHVLLSKIRVRNIDLWHPIARAVQPCVPLSIFLPSVPPPPSLSSSIKLADKNVMEWAYGFIPATVLLGCPLFYQSRDPTACNYGPWLHQFSFFWNVSSYTILASWSSHMPKSIANCLPNIETWLLCFLKINFVSCDVFIIAFLACLLSNLASTGPSLNIIWPPK